MDFTKHFGARNNLKCEAPLNKPSRHQVTVGVFGISLPSEIIVLFKNMTYKVKEGDWMLQWNEPLDILPPSIPLHPPLYIPPNVQEEPSTLVPHQITNIHPPSYISPYVQEEPSDIEPPIDFAELMDFELTTHVPQAPTKIIAPDVLEVYKIIRRSTGGIGGGGYGGAIYGELTIGAMNDVITSMIHHTGFSPTSKFIDIGCGLGKPNLHVAQYPGVAVNVGIECNPLRYYLGLTNLYAVLNAIESHPSIKHKCVFTLGNITRAESLDPFTHVYMFDIG